MDIASHAFQIAVSATSGHFLPKRDLGLVDEDAMSKVIRYSRPLIRSKVAVSRLRPKEDVVRLISTVWDRCLGL